MKFKLSVLLLALAATLAAALPAAAQADPTPQPAGPPRSVTDDEVNAIAEGLYCPVCENIPLDTCGTAACADWRNEIRLMLEAGYSEAQIVADFVRRFGDRVVGVPQDPALAALSLVTPWVIIALSLGVAFSIFLRWRSAHATQPAPAAPTTPVPAPAPAAETADRYRDLLEQDLTN